MPASSPRRRSIALYGNSYGGSVALAYASILPDRVSRLIISNAAARVDRAFADPVARARKRFTAHVPDGAGRLPAAEAADALAESDPSEAASQRAFRASMACGVAHEGPTERAYLDRLCAAPHNEDAVPRMWVEWDAGLDLFERLNAVTAPTLVIASQFDVVVPPEVVQMIADSI
jgi:pimeloyl-ACP methyl ester carboxylesterase